jgi:beta-glucosidase
MDHRVFFCSIMLLAYTALLPLQAQNNTSYPASARIEKKIDSLLALMTLSEKIGQLNLHTGSFDITGPVPTDVNAKARYDLLASGGVGAMLNVTGAKATREMQKLVMSKSRLKIPLLFGYDVIHGYKTMFPIPLAEAASFDPSVMERSARIAAVEASASGINWTFAPMVDISRDARWGRVIEGAGEDPYLGAVAAVARIKGFQTSDLKNPTAIVATAKHFAAYGFAEAGRDYNTADVSEQTLLNVVFPPFKAASDAGVGSIMTAFNDVFGVPATGSTYLQQTVLKNGWKFNGFLVTDWGTIRELQMHGYASDLKEAAKLAINSGADMDMESEGYQRHLAALMAENKVEMARLDDAVRRILRVKYRLGLFENPYKAGSEELEKTALYTPEHLAAARDAARRSIILLENKTNLLPIGKNVKKIAVIGSLAGDKDSPIASWRGRGDANSAVSLVEGLKARYGTGVEIMYAPGYVLAEGDRAFVYPLKYGNDTGKGFDEALKIAKQADLVIMAVGEEGFQSGEGRSLANIALKGRQLELLQQVYKANPKTVAVLMNGRPIAEPWLYENIPSILETWFLGSQSGHAIADVLSGDYNPAGKLPVSIPRAVGQVPIYYNHKNTGRPTTGPSDAGMVFWSHYNDIPNSPQYPFGFGRSYTTFTYSEPVLAASEIGTSGETTVSVTVTNSGSVKGEEIVQLYIRDRVASRVRPIIELKGFRKIELNPGESKQVTFAVNSSVLGFYTSLETFVVEPGAFDIMVGSASNAVKSLSLTVK